MIPEKTNIIYKGIFMVAAANSRSPSQLTSSFSKAPKTKIQENVDEANMRVYWN